MTAYAILAAVAAVLGAFLGLRRKANRERDARVTAEAQRDVAQGKAEVAEATVIVTAQVAADKDAGRVNEAQVEAKAAEATAHPERAAARERARLHDLDVVERRHNERVRAPLLKRRGKS